MALSFSLKVAAQECGLSERTLHSAMQKGELNVLRIGRRVLVTPYDLSAFLRNRTSTKEGECND